MYPIHPPQHPDFPSILSHPHHVATFHAVCRPGIELKHRLSAIYLSHQCEASAHRPYGRSWRWRAVRAQDSHTKQIPQGRRSQLMMTMMVMLIFQMLTGRRALVAVDAIRKQRRRQCFRMLNTYCVQHRDKIESNEQAKSQPWNMGMGTSHAVVDAIACSAGWVPAVVVVARRNVSSLNLPKSGTRNVRSRV